MSANIAYGEVKQEPQGGEGRVYEDPNKMASTGQGDYELTQFIPPTYESTSGITIAEAAQSSY